MSDIMGSVMCPTKDSNWITKLLFSYVALIPLLGSLPSVLIYLRQIPTPNLVYNDRAVGKE